MAAADHLDDDDEFDDYNPHPYSGGYDISAAYGSPLPPSPTTCYPVSSPAAPTAPQPRAPLPQHPAPAPPPPPPPAQPRSSSPAADPFYWPEPYDYGDAHAPRDQPMYASPDVFRGWPYWSEAQRHSACGRDYWRQCMRGLDYLFGHSDGYGERRIGVDCLGVPVYANRKGGVEDAVVVEVPPPPTGTVEWHYASEGPDQRSNRLPWYGNAEEETYAYARPAYSSCDPPYEQPAYTSYDRSYQQPAYTASYETTWFPNQSYQEVYRGEDPRCQEFLSYNADNKISSQPIFCYNQHFGEQPLHIHVEPPETVSSNKLECYENFFTYKDQNDVDNLESTIHSYEIQPYANIPYDQPEPYRPSWCQNLGYYQACSEEVVPEYDSHALAAGECWDMSSLFISPYYPQETHTYVQSHGDENV